ncbi:ring-opening amidohydrolase [Aminobacter sp. SR38]|uniref:ring-opening amidohydrolase n=1 Tax=Aminobacter sp. SR38 TaxID=2774562 RepID=UPI001FED7D7D|nr:ring-opening amidohydrolase [Aminobacter sp. SR38]
MDTSSLIKVAQSGPDDVGALDRALAAAVSLTGRSRVFSGRRRVTAASTTTRGFATAALRHYLQQFMEMTAVDAVPIIMSGGCEGVISPHLTVFFDVDVPTDRKFNRMRPSMARVLGLETRSAKEG